MAIFFDEMKTTLIRELLMKDPKISKAKEEDKQKLRTLLGLTKGQMENIFFRCETGLEGKDVLLVQVLLDSNIRAEVLKFLNEKVSSKAKAVPDLDVWGIASAQKIDQDDEFQLLAEDEKFIVMVKPEKSFNYNKRSSKKRAAGICVFTRNPSLKLID